MTSIVARFALPFVILTLVVLAVTGNLFSASPLVIALQLLAVGLSIWARRSFPAGAFRVSSDPAADAVIQRGPYRLIRHPMYTAALLFIWTGVLSHLSLLTLALGIAVTAVVSVRIAVEERVLRDHYIGYSEYAASTRAIIPYLL